MKANSAATLAAAGEALQWCLGRWRALLDLPWVGDAAMAAPEVWRHRLTAASIDALLVAFIQRHLPEHLEAAGPDGRVPVGPELRQALTRGNNPPPVLHPATIHGVHQELLSYAVQRRDGRPVVAPARGARKRIGSYSTPPLLARALAMRTLAPFRRCQEMPAILDPAAGAGALLLAAVDALCETGCPDRRRALGRHGLHSLERDPVAGTLLRWAIVAHCSLQPEDWAGVVRHTPIGEALAGQPLLPQGNPWQPGQGAPGSITWPEAFPHVVQAGGFDAVLGNPPWETLQTNSAELAEVHGGAPGTGPSAATIDRMLAQAAEDPVLAAEWKRHRTERADLSQILRSQAKLLGYRCQGRGKLQAERLFLERSWWALRPGGRLGMLIPAGLQSDRGAKGLRHMLWDTGRWRWWLQCENRAGWFPIDSRMRFGLLVADRVAPQQGSPPVRMVQGITTAQRLLQPRPPAIRYPREIARRLSPNQEALLDAGNTWELQLLERLHGGHPPLVGPGAPLGFRQGDFNMTRDAGLFIPREAAEADGYQQSPDQVWRHPDMARDPLLPLYQGAMIGDLHPNAGWFTNQRGARSSWMRAPSGTTTLRPRYLIPQQMVAERLQRHGRTVGPRLAVRALSNATNERTVMAALLWGQPCGNSLAVLEADPAAPITAQRNSCAWAAAVLGSLPFDWAWRRRMAGTNLNGYLLAEAGWPTPDPKLRRRASNIAAGLGWVLPAHGNAWRSGAPPRPVLDPALRRRRLALLDALIAQGAGLTGEDLAAMLQPTAAADSDPRGHWRIDRDLAPHQRRPARAVRALRWLEQASR